jgi:predicted molibdopterin-dependent oxidoreductase YjgC
MSRLDKFGSHNDRWMRGAKRDARPTWRILANLAGVLGAKWKYATAEEVFAEMSSTLPAFKGLTYQRIGSQGVGLTSIPETAPLAQR